MTDLIFPPSHYAFLQVCLLCKFTIQKFLFNTAQKMKFSIKHFFSKSDQIRSFLQIWSHLLKKSLMENFLLCAV